MLQFSTPPHPYPSRQTSRWRLAHRVHTCRKNTCWIEQREELGCNVVMAKALVNPLESPEATMSS